MVREIRNVLEGGHQLRKQLPSEPTRFLEHLITLLRRVGRQRQARVQEFAERNARDLCHRNQDPPRGTHLLRFLRDQGGNPLQSFWVAAVCHAQRTQQVTFELCVGQCGLGKTRNLLDGHVTEDAGRSPDCTEAALAQRRLDPESRARNLHNPAFSERMRLRISALLLLSPCSLLDRLLFSSVWARSGRSITATASLSSHRRSTSLWWRPSTRQHAVHGALSFW
mmetsp:Transcript_43613/g.115197  ORF Transcript_43613/g.115197 Transcript_43613/m.115197 type:complete len:224 (+) Transcript_43613:938-1609(+)